MALQVWLPLRGDLKNLGLSDVDITNNGATINDNGKIGKCYSFNNTYIIGSKGPLSTNTEKFSVAFWIYFNSVASGHSCLYSQRTLTGEGITVWRHDTHIRFDDGSNIWEATNTFATGIWYHVVLTRSNAAKKLYINGVLVDSTTTVGVLRNISTKFIVGKSTPNIDTTAPNANPLNGRMNDLRIYDHCLSPKEVKEISKGLVLHYTLDDYSRNTLLSPGVELYDYIQSSGTLWIDTGVLYDSTKTSYKVEIRFSMYALKGTYDGVFGAYKSESHKTLRIIRGNSNSKLWYYYNTKAGGGSKNETTTPNSDIYEVTMTSTNTIVNDITQGTSNTYTLSPTSATNTTTESFYLFDQAVNSIPSKSKIWYFRLYDGAILIRNMLPCTYLGEPGMWDTVENKFYKNLGTGQFILGNKIATTYNNSVIYDCSGYQNNGLSVNTLTISDSSPRYSHSTKFNSSAIKVTNNNWLSLGMQELTINLWIKASSWPANTRIFSCTESGGFNIEQGNSGYYRFTVHVYTNSGKTSYAYKYDSNEILISALPVDLWNMLTLIYSTTGTKTYINGLLHHTYTNQSYGIHFNTNARLFLGCEANTSSPTTPYFNGLISDFRIYTTILSEEDIKELYDTSAIIDNLNNLYTRELIEDNMDYVEISKKGIIKTDSLTEGNNGVIFSSDNIECSQLIEI